MLSETLQKILQKIEQGTTIPNHPYKVACLSSINDNSPEQRMVVIRKLEQNQLTIYTDKRSPKVAQFNNNPNASILFYVTEEMTQVILKGTVSVMEDKDLEVWKSIPEFAHKDYTTLLAPGTTIENSKLDYNPKTPNFCYLLFNFKHIDYLNISKPYNSRFRYVLNSNNEWDGSYLVP